MSDEFYVGYLPKAPGQLGRGVKRIAGGVVLAGLVVGGLLAFRQPPFASSKFEYGMNRDYSGVIEEWPYPILRTQDASYLLVAPGKRGLDVSGMQNKSVQLRGSLIERGTDRMLEVIPESMHEAPGATPAASTSSSLGTVLLRGEIVDSKCYLGVMNPGNGKVHRDCAARCISGGAPPALVVNDANGDTRILLLVGSDGRKLNKEVLPYVAEPLEISGDLVRSGASFVLKAEPTRFRRYQE